MKHLSYSWRDFNKS